MGPGPDFFPEDDFRLFRGAQGDRPFDAAKYTLAIAPADLPNRRKLEEASEYVTDIMQRLYDREVRSLGVHGAYFSLSPLMSLTYSIACTRPQSNTRK